MAPLRGWIYFGIWFYKDVVSMVLRSRKRELSGAERLPTFAAWRRKVEAARLPIKDQPKIPGFDRFHFRDPFGNNIELIQRT